MAVKTVTKYVTSDGHIFDDRHEANDHERMVEFLAVGVEIARRSPLHATVSAEQMKVYLTDLFQNGYRLLPRGKEDRNGRLL